MEKVKIKNIFDFQKKSKIKAGDGFKLGEAQYPFYTSSNELTKSINEYLFEDESLIFGTGGLASIHFCNEKFAVSTDCFVIQPKDKKRVFSKFVYYYLSGNMNILENGFKGAGLKHISKDYLENIEIPLPNLATQQRIAAILDQADAIILNNRAIVKKYDALTQSLFLDMFGDPVKNEKGWEKKEFSKVAKNENSKRVPVKQSDRDEREGEYPYYGATGIIDTIDDYKFDGEYLLIAEDGKNLLFRKKNNAFMAYGKFWVNNHAHILSCNNICNLKYLEFFLNSIDLSPFISGIDQIKLNKASLDRIPVIVPPIELQNQFAERVSVIEAQKQQAQLELAKSEELFQSLLQKAFKGELN